MEDSVIGEKVATATPDPARTVDFDGPNDPDNPMNWSIAKKTATIVIVTMMTLLS